MIRFIMFGTMSMVSSVLAAMEGWVNFLSALEQSPIAEWIQFSDYGFYIALAGHAIGMAVVVGVLYTLAARTLGFARDVPLRIFDKMVSVAWLGFALNAVTGVMLFSANGSDLVRNPYFLIKLILIATGSVVASLMWRNLAAEPGGFDGTAAASAKSRMFAVASLVLWTGAIVAGRVIGYTADY